MKAILACTLLLTGCAAYRVSPGDDGALRAAPVKGSSEIAVTQVRGPLQGFQCFEPLFFTLTLGLIPANCVDTFAVSVTDRKSTRLNSSHITISYAVFCL